MSFEAVGFGLAMGVPGVLGGGECPAGLGGSPPADRDRFVVLVGHVWSTKLQPAKVEILMHGP